MKQRILTLDYWQDQVQYLGKRFPSGIIGCQVLNLPKETVSALQSWGTQLQQVILSMQTGRVTANQLGEAKESILQILNLLQEYPPFSWLDCLDYENRGAAFFTEEVRKNAQAYVRQLQLTGPLATVDPAYQAGAACLGIVQVFSQLPSSLLLYQSAMKPFAEILNAGERTEEDYAEAFSCYFPEEADLSPENPAWMALANISVQYRTVFLPEKRKFQMVKQMHYLSFYGLFRSDLFEGLCVGHAPRQCPICGKWFLTTDARHTKYCGGLAPDDPKGRTCRQIGNLRGRAHRELAADHPLKIIYERRLATIRQQLCRGTLDPALAEAMKRLAKNKLQRAISNRDYAKAAYPMEMEQPALMEEAQRGRRR